MTIESTDRQQQALDALRGTLPHVVDPRTSESYALISEADYNAIHDVLEDDRRQPAIRAVGLRNAISRTGEEP